MTDDAEFRDELKRVVRKHDPDASELRKVCEDLSELADRFEATEDVL